VIDTNSLLVELSSDPKRAYVELGNRIADCIRNKAPTLREIITLAKIMAAYADNHNLAYYAKDDEEDWPGYLGKLISGAEYLGHEIEADDTVKAAFEYAAEYKNGKPLGFAYLTSEEKKAIHKHIDVIRKTIESSALEMRKKRAIYTRLAKLSAEIDKDGTNTDVLFGFIGELSFSLSKFEKDNRKAIEHAKDILEIIFRRRSTDEGISLPPADDFPLLPSSSKTE